MTQLLAFIVLLSGVVAHYYPTSYQQVYLTPSYRPYVYRPYVTNQIVVDDKPSNVNKPSETSCQLSSRISTIPLQIVKEDDINVVKVFNDNIYQETLVELQTQDQRIPAVRVVLPEPMLLSDLRTSIPFPSGFTIYDHGTRTPLPILTVLAPVADFYYPNTLYRPAYPVKPYQVSVVYAIPIQYQYYPSYRPLYEAPSLYYPYGSYVHTSRPTPASVNTTTPAAQAKPEKKPDNLVTVLEFPSSVATPGVLYYQEVSDDNELVNRNPPQAVIPSGIVQSTAPQSAVTVFVNSKESAFLQTLRDEAEKNKQKVTNKGTVIEALY